MTRHSVRNYSADRTNGLTSVPTNSLECCEIPRGTGSCMSSGRQRCRPILCPKHSARPTDFRKGDPRRNTNGGSPSSDADRGGAGATAYCRKIVALCGAHAREGTSLLGRQWSRGDWYLRERATASSVRSSGAHKLKPAGHTLFNLALFRGSRPRPILAARPCLFTQRNWLDGRAFVHQKAWYSLQTRRRERCHSGCRPCPTTQRR
jgi:hypothetical protein